MSRRRPDEPRHVLSALGKLVGIAALMGLLLAGLAVPFAGLAGVGARTVAAGMDDLPRDLTAEPLAQRTRVLAADGSLLTTWYDQNRVNVTLDKVAPIMRQAIVSIEDYRFYQHGALDLQGTLRAFITNQASSGVVQGGSSITQQMVKQTLVSQAKTAKEAAAAQAETYARKFRELQYAIAFEQKYSKDWILERYLNVSYFGDGAYGIEAAARHYFSRPAAGLSLAQAALLAGIVKNPSQFDPTNHPQDARQRRNVVLARMAQLDVITKRKERKASRSGLHLKVTRSRNGCVGTNGEFFCDYVREWLKQDPLLGKTPAERERLLDTGGLTIETNLDPRMQRAADDSVRAHVNPTDQAIGGLAMVEPGTGKVRALAQSRPMGRDRARGETYLNYVVPKQYGDSAGFQAGSTFKAFVLAAALKQGIPLSTTIYSPQQMTLPAYRFRYCDGLQYGGDWTVENSTGAGNFNLYTGTRLSVNTFFAQLEARTGLCDPITLAKDVGVAVRDKNDWVGPFTLGITDTNPLTMAGAYATWAARGRFCEPHPVSRILDSSGKVVAEYADDCQQLVPEPVADAVNDVLEGVQQPGGFGYQAGLALTQPSAGKTGTTSFNKAVWFIGYTPNLATAAMIAGANSLGHPISLNGQYVGGRYISGAHGSTTAGPMWGDAMHVIDDFLPDESFVPPDPNAIQGRPVTVPDVGGLAPADAASRLQAAGFVPSIGPFEHSETHEKGTVSRTAPQAGATLGTGTPITIYVSDGPSPKKR